ncbi:MAG: M48 family metalloprotease [Deltaproteobacteria bacterium]|nr:M48 family metalloprotease [Deltaproteobacteria bacterium]
MFNNIIYFIVVLLIYNVSFPDSPPEDFLTVSLGPLVLSWIVFAFYCARVFGRLFQRIREGEESEGILTDRYQRLNVRLSVLAIFLFTLAVHFFNLKQWLSLIPGFRQFSVLQGILGLAVFFFYLCTIWYVAHPAYRAIFRVGISRGSFILSQLRFNLPILFPWLILSFVYDLLALSPWPGINAVMNSVYGQMVFFAVFIILLMAVLPKFIQSWWGCKPLPSSEKADLLRLFLAENGFKYRGLLTWPIFEGRMLTAGIMGIVPRYRYILVADSLLKALSADELKAVLAHEMGHVRYRHLFFYILFFIGFMVLSFGLADISIYLAFLWPGLMDLIAGGEARSASIFYLIISLPMLISLLVYFRFVMGFFMRHFERQADLYSAAVMGTPIFTIRSLETIAFLSGKSRDIPNWHHFSIRERVAYLKRAYQEPDLLRRHNRAVFILFLIYLVCIAGLAYLFNWGPVKRYTTYAVIEQAIRRELTKEPQNVELYLSLATVYQQMGKEREALRIYEQIIRLDPYRAAALNNLAWLLATASDRDLRDPDRAVELAKRAVTLERSPGFLDTLAEAYFVNGCLEDAIKTIKEALATATENMGYYERQLKRFEKGGAGH